MTSGHPNGRADPDAAAERLSSEWDAVVTGHAVEIDDEGLVAVAQRLHATATIARERPGFRQDLRDTLMHAPTTALPIPGTLLVRRIDPSAPRPFSLLPAALRRSGGRWLSLAATVALLLTTAAGGYLASVGLPGKDSRDPTIGAVGAPSPDGTPTRPTGEEIVASCQELQPYVPGCGAMPNVVSQGLIVGSALPGANLDVTRVQLWRFQVEAGRQIEYDTSVEPVVGVGMDMVINGAYAAQFDGPVVVARNQAGIRVLSEYPAAGVDVELVRGDVVTYGLGTKRYVRNVLSTSILQFKTVLFYDGTPFPDTLLTDTNSESDWSATVDGEGTLPNPLAGYRNQKVSIVLTYSVLYEGIPFPPDTKLGSVILGPVDPVNGPVGTEGFVLWAISVGG